MLIIWGPKMLSPEELNFSGGEGGGGGGGQPPDLPRKCVLCTHLLGGIAFQYTVVASPLFTCFLRV